MRRTWSLSQPWLPTPRYHYSHPALPHGPVLDSLQWQFVDRQSSGFTFTISTTTGTAQLYASFSNEHPTKAAGDHQFTSACGTNACGPSFAHGSALHVTPSDPAFCPRLPCLIYVAVYGVSNATFSLLGTIEEHEARAISLADGDVQQGALPHPGSYARFTFYCDPVISSFIVDVVASRGDPDLFVNTGSAWPTRQQHDLASSTASHEALVVHPADSSACMQTSDAGVSERTGCTFRMVVRPPGLNPRPVAVPLPRPVTDVGSVLLRGAGWSLVRAGLCLRFRHRVLHCSHVPARDATPLRWSTCEWRGRRGRADQLLSILCQGGWFH